MRILSRWRWLSGFTMSGTVLSAVVLHSLAAQPPGGSPSASGSDAQARETGGQSSEFLPGERQHAASGNSFGATVPANAPPTDYAILSADGQSEVVTAFRVFRYVIEPGTAKPKRLDADAVSGGGMYVGGMGGMGMGGMGMGGPSGGYGMPGGMGGMPGAGGTGGMGSKSGMGPVVTALVISSEEDNPRAAETKRAEIKVVVDAPGFGGQAGASGEGMSSSAGGPETFSTFVELDTQDASLRKRFTGPLKSTTQQECANLAELVRLDVWIEDTRAALRASRNDPKGFAATESHLKKLLTEEYAALLSKQRSDVQRLQKRLEQLQADLERRAQAKDRVVDVQLGKLVLEAQGLLDDQR